MWKPAIVVLAGMLVGAVVGGAADPAPMRVVCGCRERPMPQYASLRDSHRMLSCTIVIPSTGIPSPTACVRWDGVATGFQIQTASQ